MEEANAVELVKDLTDVFKHRHRFYWATYYKLLFYHLAVIALPYVVYHFLKGDPLYKADYPFLVSLLVLLAWTLSLVNIWLIQRSRAYLAGEDLRLRIVHKAIRETYMTQFGINLYPDIGALEAQKRCEEKSNNNQELEGDSLGGYMEQLFSGFLILVSLLGALLFSLLASSLSGV